MASSGWQGERTLYSWGSYSSLAFNLRVDSISRNGNTVSVTGALRLIYHNSAGGTGYYNYIMSATPAGGGTVSYSTWSGKSDGYYQEKNISGSFTVQSASTTSADFNVSWSSNSGNTGTAKWQLSFPSGGTLPTGLKAEWVSSTWNTVNIKSSVTSWGTYTGTPEIQQIVVDSSATSSNWETKGRQVRSAWTTSTSSTQGVTTANSTSYSGGIVIKGAMNLKVAAWAITSAGTYPGGYINASTTYHTPPAPMQTLTYTQEQRSTDVRIYVSAVGGSSSNNYGNTVTTYIRFSTNGGSSYSNWASMGTGQAWNTYTGNFTCAYKANVVIQTKQTYSGLDSEIKQVSFTASSGTAPSAGTVTVTGSTWNTVTLQASGVNYGKPDGISGRKLAIGVHSMTDTTNKRENQVSNVTSATTTVTNSSIYPSGTALQLKGMLPVRAYLWVWNTVSSNTVDRKTDPYYLPPAPGVASYTDDGGGDYTISYVGVVANNVTDYTAADLTRTVRYKIDNGSWVYVDNAAQKALDTVTSETIQIAPTHSATVECWLSYKGKESTHSSFTIVNSSDPVMLYGSVNGEATKIRHLYGSVNGETVKIKKLYAPVDGVARKVFEDV